MDGIYNTIALDGQNTGKETVLTAPKGSRVHFTKGDHTAVNSLDITFAPTQTGTPTPAAPITPTSKYGLYYYVAGTATASGTSYYKSLNAYYYGGTLNPIKGYFIQTYAILTLTSTAQSWEQPSGNRRYRAKIDDLATTITDTTGCLCTHAVYNTAASSSFGNFRYQDGYVTFYDGSALYTLTTFKNWLDEQNTAGTPVRIVYPLNKPINRAISPTPYTIRAGANYVYSNDGDISLTVVEPFVTLKRPSDMAIQRQDIYAGEYVTCTGAVKADRIGWRYADLTLTFDELTTDALDILSGMYGAITFYFDDSDGAHAEQVIKTEFTNTPTRLTLPDGQYIWKDCGVTLRFIDAHN